MHDNVGINVLRCSLCAGWMCWVSEASCQGEALTLVHLGHILIHLDTSGTSKMMGCARWSTCKYFGDKSAAGDVDSGFYTGYVHGVREKRCGHASVERERVQRARLDGTFA